MAKADNTHGLVQAFYHSVFYYFVCVSIALKLFISLSPSLPLPLSLSFSFSLPHPPLNPIIPSPLSLLLTLSFSKEPVPSWFWNSGNRFAKQILEMEKDLYVIFLGPGDPWTQILCQEKEKGE